MQKEDIVRFLTNIPDSQFHASMTAKALEASKKKELVGEQKRAFEAKRKEVIQSLMKFDSFKWYLENLILPFTIPKTIVSADFDGRQKLDIIKSDVYRSLFTEVIQSARSD